MQPKKGGKRGIRRLIVALVVGVLSAVGFLVADSGNAGASGHICIDPRDCPVIWWPKDNPPGSEM